MIAFTGHPSDNLIPCAIMVILLLIAIPQFLEYRRQAQQAETAPVSSAAQVNSGSE
jgi:hypothetical protein